MSDKRELVELVRRGGRVDNNFTLHKAAGEPCPGFNHNWRVVVCCDDELDVVECSRCGVQAVVRCDFDDEFA